MVNDTQLTYIGKKLNGMIFKKEYPSPLRDYVKPAVLFYDLYNMGYVMTTDDVRRALKLAKAHFSDEMVEEMGYLADTFYFLKEGLESPSRNGYGITKEELEENS